jgi:type II secretory pathway component PulF
MEVSIMTAADRSGRLDHGCHQLSEYFGALEKSRAIVIKRSAYPVFVLHFGILVLALPKLFVGGGPREYAEQTLGVFLLIYGIAAVIALVVAELRRMGGSSPAMDRMLRAIPLIGKVRSSFALARFCATYETQLQAGVNVMDSLSSAGQASQSAGIVSAVRAALPELRAGGQVAELLARSNAFPSTMVRALRVAEETGDLDKELERLTEDFEQQALSRMETVGEWLPKLIYLTVLLYLGYQMVEIYQKVLSGYEKAIEM